MDWLSRYPREMYMLFQIGRSPDVSNSFIEWLGAFMRELFGLKSRNNIQKAQGMIRAVI
jgi:hypothetical protein